jgi:hypothetical protein
LNEIREERFPDANFQFGVSEGAIDEGLYEWLGRSVMCDVETNIKHAKKSSFPNPGASSDNWYGRKYGMRCGRCIFFVEKKSDAQGLSQVMGRCRRHAPTMQGFPVVFPSDWCGDHKLDENK